MSIILYKEAGETPLECIERARKIQGIAENIPMTYAGRLDPMAEGVLVALVGEECKEKERYLGFDKEYELEILFGVATDAQDVLGVIKDMRIPENPSVSSDFLNIKSEKFVQKIKEKYVGSFSQKYPVYSSKTIAGKALHAHARQNTLPEDDADMPSREVKIYSIDFLDEQRISGSEITANILNRIAKVKGDFRQVKITEDWKTFGEKYPEVSFLVIKIKVKCSTGTYMRVLAENIGSEADMPALAFSIKRTAVGSFILPVS